MDTIFALATAQGRAGVAVVRISGPDAISVASLLCKDVPAARQAVMRLLSDQNGGHLDQALVLVFEGPASFTGEDVVEFHLHGSVAVVAAVLRELGNTSARLAEPGEFTRRALENNKLDLTQVEGLADLIDAETEQQRLQALRTLSGDIGREVEMWRSRLVRAASLIEVTIDFSDEDVPVDVTPEVLELLDSVSHGIQEQLDGFHAAERVRVGFEVAILGAPNAGKSTLLNALAMRDAAITSAIAGTTRDVIEVRLDVDGLPVTLLDTAGLRVAEDEIEAEGVARAVSRAKTADLRVFLLEPGEVLGLEPENGDIVRAPKADVRSDAVLSVSGKTGEGLKELIAEISLRLTERASSGGLVAHERQRRVFEEAMGFLSLARTRIGHGAEFYDIAAEELRSVIRSLECVVGRVDVEDLLDEIFSSFCLGK